MLPKWRLRGLVPSTRSRGLLTTPAAGVVLGLPLWPYHIHIYADVLVDNDSGPGRVTLPLSADVTPPRLIGNFEFSIEPA